MPTVEWTNSTRDWPSSSAYLCWHCAHPFSTVPVYLPVARDVSKNIFTFHGNYCSWNCVKAYARSLQKLKPTAAQYIALFAFLTSYRPLCCIADTSKPHPYDCPCLQNFRGLREAEPKEVLLSFGGTQSIQEYRRGFMTVTSIKHVHQYFRQNTQLKEEFCRLERRPYTYIFVDKKEPYATGMGTRRTKESEKESQPTVHTSWEVVQLLSYKG